MTRNIHLETYCSGAGQFFNRGKAVIYCRSLFKCSLLYMYIIYYTYIGSYYRWRSSGLSCTHSIGSFDDSNLYSSNTDNFHGFVCLRDTLQIGCI